MLIHVFDVGYLPLYDKSMGRRNINLTISEDVIEKAKTLEINASQAAEEGISEAIKRKHEEIWLEENKLAIKTYNEKVLEHGPLIKPLWAK